MSASSDDDVDDDLADNIDLFDDDVDGEAAGEGGAEAQSVSKGRRVKAPDRFYRDGTKYVISGRAPIPIEGPPPIVLPPTGNAMRHRAAAARQAIAMITDMQNRLKV